MNTNKLYHNSIIKETRTKELEVNNFEAYSVEALIDFLKISHQRFLNQSIPKIEQSFLMLVKSFNENNDLKTLFKLFLKFQINFKQHIEIVEKTIFPYAEVLHKASLSKSVEAVLLIHFSKYSIADFVSSHENNECYLTEIIFLLNQQETLESHPNYNILLKQIYQFDNELKTHDWLEDNVLVKKVEEIELAIYNFVKND
jgi:iron-sulfur cluster repair protein YtfE (RIC family)